jgi:hypothetical protein
MSRSILVFLEEQQVCPGKGSGSRLGLMRDKLGPGLGPKDGRGSKVGRAGRFRKLTDEEKESLKHV